MHTMSEMLCSSEKPMNKLVMEKFKKHDHERKNRNENYSTKTIYLNTMYKFYTKPPYLFYNASHI